MKSAALFGGGAKAKSNFEPAHRSVPPSRQQAPTKSPRFRRAVERVHSLGPRVVAELLSEIGADLHRVERFADLDRYPPSFLSAIGADTWAPAVFVVRSS